MIYANCELCTSLVVSIRGMYLNLEEFSRGWRAFNRVNRYGLYGRKLFKWRTGCIRKRAAEGKRQGVSAYKALGKLDAC